MSAKTSKCKNPNLEQELKDGISTDADNIHLVSRLMLLLQTEVGRDYGMMEAYQLCLSKVRKTAWRMSADWHDCVLELCENFQVEFPLSSSLMIIRAKFSSGEVQGRPAVQC